MSQRLRIGKVPVDVLTFAQALDAIEALVEKKDGGFVFTPNVDHVVVADSNDAFAAAYQRASLSLADGMPVVWASRLLGTPLPERVTGADIITPLLERAGQRGWRVYFLGAGPGVAQKAADIVTARYGTNVVGIDAPMVRLDDAAPLDAIAATPREALAFFDCAHGPRRRLVLVGMTTTTPAGHLRSRFSSHTARQPTAATSSPTTAPAPEPDAPGAQP